MTAKNWNHPTLIQDDIRGLLRRQPFLLEEEEASGSFTPDSNIIDDQKVSASLDHMVPQLGQNQNLMSARCLNISCYTKAIDTPDRRRSFKVKLEGFGSSFDRNGFLKVVAAIFKAV